MIKKICILMFVASFLSMNAQERCGTEAMTKHQMEKYPAYKIEREKLNTQTDKWIKKNPNYSPKTIITIPVVVHVVWKTNAENISDTRIYEQIEILNNDFRRTNIDQIMTPNVWQSIAADCEIEFCLAQTDPNGNATTGINRLQTSIGQFSMWGGSSVKDVADSWGNGEYLNIWVCNLGIGLLGYAVPASSFIGNEDGVVINYPNFGLTSSPQYGKGRTATHEVGHWLNLEHIWGDNTCGDDNISDTPEQENENDGCPAFPHNANSCNTTNANGDMFMNYMDYTNDACMNLFTIEQKTRMLSAINQYRPNMLNHNLCNGPTNILDTKVIKKELLKIVNILGKETTNQNINTPLFYIYNDGSVEKKIILK